MKWILAGLATALLAGAALAAPRTFALSLSGGGRACAGGLFVRAKTLEWNSSFSVCKPSPYKVLERGHEGERQRVVFELLQRSSQCRYTVVEVEQVQPGSWDVTGYPSVDAYRHRTEQGGRSTLSCPMYGRAADPAP